AAATGQACVEFAVASADDGGVGAAVAIVRQPDLLAEERGHGRASSLARIRASNSRHKVMRRRRSASYLMGVPLMQRSSACTRRKRCSASISSSLPLVICSMALEEALIYAPVLRPLVRSEERRVGKQCACR